MNLGLDYDGVVTAEPTGFANFVNNMRFLGHKVYIVTMRYPSECLKDPMMRKWSHGVDGVVPTSRRAKKEVLDELGITCHVFIDDHPQAIHQSAAQIWGTPSAEGVVYTVNHNTGEHEVSDLDQPEDEDMVMIRSKMLIAPPKKIPELQSVTDSPVLGINNSNTIHSTFDGETYKVKLGVFGVTGVRGNFIPVLTDEHLHKYRALPIVRADADSLKKLMQADFAIPHDMALGWVGQLRSRMVGDIQEVYGDVAVTSAILRNLFQTADLELVFQPLYLKGPDGEFQGVFGWGVGTGRQAARPVVQEYKVEPSMLIDDTGQMTMRAVSLVNPG